MNKSIINISGLEVDVTRKKIKNIHLSVVPPDGRVRISVPTRLSDAHVAEAVISRLVWIKKQQAIIQARPRKIALAVITGETHYLWGKPYRLEVVERRGKHEVNIQDDTIMQLFVRPGTSDENRRAVLDGFYRAALKHRIPALLDIWEKKIKVQTTSFGVKRMKTRWGTCNIQKKRIWLNLTLAQKPPECLEYVVVHELVHLIERYHNKRFWGLVERLLPKWRVANDMLLSEGRGNDF